MSQPDHDLSTTGDNTATRVADDISTLLALAVAGDTQALVEARDRYDALYDYLAVGGNPLPAQWSHSVAWRDPAHDPVIAAEVEAATADTSPAPAEVSLIADDGGFNFDALPDEPVTSHLVETIGRNNPFTVVPPTTYVAPAPATAPLPAVPATQAKTKRHIKPAPVYTIKAVGPGTTLEVVKEYIEERVNGGTDCPACDRFIKIYPRTIHTGIAQALTKMYHLGNQYQRGWVHVGQKIGEGCEASKAHYWGLVEQQSKVDTVHGDGGLWRLTDLGLAFVLGQVTVPKYANVFKAECKELHGPQINIVDALGKRRGEYNDFMSNASHE